MDTPIKVSFSYESHQSLLSAVDTLKFSHYREGYALLDGGDYPPKSSQKHEQSFYLTIRFNAHAIDFQICDFSLDDFDEMTLKSETLKAKDIEEELNLYIGMVNAFYSRTIKIDLERADQMRRDAHNALAEVIDGVIKEKLGVELNTAQSPSMLANTIVTRWLHMRGLKEDYDGKRFSSRIESCAIFAEEAKIDRKQLFGI